MCGIEPFRSWSGRWPFLGVFLLEVHCGGVRREGIFSCSVAAVVLRCVVHWAWVQVAEDDCVCFVLGSLTLERWLVSIATSTRNLSCGSH